MNVPDAFTNVRTAASTESAVVAKAKNGEVLDFADDGSDAWSRVTLRSGKKGYMHSSRIPLHRRVADLVEAPLNDEIYTAARRQGDRLLSRRARYCERRRSGNEAFL